MNTITVLVPTANRPVLLASALASIARQSALARVTNVLVSENAGARESEGVCRQYASLPIRYLFQEPALTPVRHLHVLFTRSDLADWVALLCDDDWWGPGHLQAMVEALEGHPEAVVAYGNCQLTDAEPAGQARTYHPAAFHLRPPGAGRLAPMLFCREEVLISTWVHTPFHFSGMLARRAALARAAEHLLKAHPYYADRILFAALGLMGSAVFEPLPQVFIRRHEGNYDSYTAQGVLDRAVREGRGRVTELARSAGLDPARVFRTALEKQPGPLSPEFSWLLWDSVGYAELKRCDLVRFLGGGPAIRLWKRFERRTWRLFKAVLPPVILDAYRGLRRRVMGR